MPYPPIGPFPTPPNTNDVATFPARSDAFLGHFPTFRDEANSLAEYLDDLALATGPGIFKPGSVATPGIQFQGRAGVGIAVPGSATLSIVINDLEAARFVAGGTATAGPFTVVTLEKGDARYYAKGSNYLIGFTPAGVANNGLLSTVTGQNFVLRAGTEDATGLYTFKSSDNTDVARIDEEGATATSATTIITRQKGDARFAPIASAARYKEDAEVMEAPDLSGLDLYSWVWGGQLEEDDWRRGQRGAGLIADDLVAVAPLAVRYDASGDVAGIDPLTLAGYTIAYLNARLATLEARLEALEA
jgi:hypothetical protein